MTPQRMVRLRRRTLTVMFVLAIASWIAMQIPAVKSGPAWLRVPPTITLVFLATFGFLVWAWVHFTLMANVEAIMRRGGLLCPRCGYDLDGLDQRGACPECGAPYRHDAVRQWWRGYHTYLGGRRADRAPPVVSWWDRRRGWWRMPEWECPTWDDDEPDSPQTPG